MCDLTVACPLLKLYADKRVCSHELNCTNVVLLGFKSGGLMMLMVVVVGMGTGRGGGDGGGSVGGYVVMVMVMI